MAAPRAACRTMVIGADGIWPHHQGAHAGVYLGNPENGFNAACRYPSGRTSERLTCPSAKLVSIEAMFSSRVSLSLMKRS